MEDIAERKQLEGKLQEAHGESAENQKALLLPEKPLPWLA